MFFQLIFEQLQPDSGFNDREPNYVYYLYPSVMMGNIFSFELTENEMWLSFYTRPNKHQSAVCFLFLLVVSRLVSCHVTTNRLRLLVFISTHILVHYSPLPCSMSVGSYFLNVIFVLIQEAINLCTPSSP